MNKEIQIRQAVPGDAGQLADLAKRGMPGYPFESVYDPSALKIEIASGIDRIVVEDSDKNIRGTAVLGEGYMAEIKRVLVDPDLRKHHLGQGLTDNLKMKAIKKGVIPWADVRADQIGMQKAAHAYDLRLYPISVEAGKHVVYAHKNDSGPARESMVHMSGLSLAQSTNELNSTMCKWSNNYVRRLVDNMADSLVSQDKDIDLVKSVLPSASIVKDRIEKNIQRRGLAHTQLTPDIIALSNNDARCIIISPDASGFVEGGDSKSIISLVDLGLDLGLQIVTCYLPVENIALINELISSGMQPAMVRPWQLSAKDSPRWEVGLRKTANHYEKSLHTLNLDTWVYAGILSVIQGIDSTINMWAGYYRGNPKDMGGCII
ncbi:MAG: hypothetical protein WAV40_00330 [Microgenomates group bacterium]